MKNNTLCIEFVGIWGSGKTTLINKISTLLIEDGLNIAKLSDFSDYGRSARYALILLLFLSNPLYFYRWLLFSVKIFFILKPAGKIESDIYKTLIKTHIIKNVLLRLKRPDVLLWEGGYHLLPMFHNMNKLTDKELLFSVATLYDCSKPYAAFIELRMETAYKRVIKDHENGFCRFSSDELSDLKSRYICMIENQNKIKEILQNKFVINIDGEESVDTKSSYLYRLILELFNSKI